MNATTNGNVQVSPAGKAAWIVLVIAWICFLIPFPGLGLFLGWPLNLVAFILAIVAMAKGGAMKGVIQLILSLVASPIIYFIGAAIFVGAVGVMGQKDAASRAAASQASSQEVVAAASPSEPNVELITTTATDLFRAYDENEIAADAKYKGNALLISGRIESIQSDFGDNPVVHLEAGTFEWVQLSGLSKEVASQLSKGREITLRCRGAGEVMGFPAADQCTPQ